MKGIDHYGSTLLFAIVQINGQESLIRLSVMTDCCDSV